MQNALQNPHYKKIWEKVIMNRHPSAKSLEEALEKESTKLGSIILYNSKYKGKTTFVEYNVGNYDKHCYECYSEVTKVMLHEDLFIENSKQIILCGRPITLFDVIQLLNKTNEYCCFVFDGWGIYKTTHDAKYNHTVVGICDFKADLLCETTPDTWEKIANLID